MRVGGSHPSLMFVQPCNSDKFQKIPLTNSYQNVLSSQNENLFVKLPKPTFRKLPKKCPPPTLPKPIIKKKENNVRFDS